jgi:hypothetical protein
MQNLSRRIFGTGRRITVATLALLALLSHESYGASTQNITTSDTPTIVQAVNLTSDTNLDLLIGTGRVGQFTGLAIR